MHYVLRKPITIEALMKAGGDCEEFRENLHEFINMEITGKIDLYEEYSIEDIVPCFHYWPDWEPWLIEKGFIQLEGMLFRVGQYFTHEEFPKCVMSISRINATTINVIAHQLPGYYMDSNRITIDGMQVENQQAITMTEMRKMTGFSLSKLTKIRFCSIVPEPLGV